MNKIWLPLKKCLLFLTFVFLLYAILVTVVVGDTTYTRDYFFDFVIRSPDGELLDNVKIIVEGKLNEGSYFDKQNTDPVRLNGTFRMKFHYFRIRSALDAYLNRPEEYPIAFSFLVEKEGFRKTELELRNDQLEHYLKKEKGGIQIYRIPDIILKKE